MKLTIFLLLLFFSALYVTYGQAPIFIGGGGGYGGGGTPTAPFVINAPSGFSGNIFDYQINGTSQLRLTQAPNLILAAGGAMQSNLFTDQANNKGYITTGGTAMNFEIVNRVTGNVPVVIDDIAAQSADSFQIRDSTPTKQFYVDNAFNLTIVPQKSSTGQRFVCIDTAGKLVSSTTACVGT